MILPDRFHHNWKRLKLHFTAIDIANPCSSAAITSGKTITAAGNYCVAQSMTGNIVVNASDVYLSLNNRTVTGTITVNAINLVSLSAMVR